MSLFDTLPDPPAYHTGDPDTSREALNQLEGSGGRAAHQRLVYALVRACPGLTAVELWDEASHQGRAQLGELQEVRRRLVDLEAKGLVQKGAARHCRVRGSRQATWYVVGFKY